ncbi:hypothetical protein BRADI_3g01703v3 [Brachypodium distachyon]|uniref:Acidic protein n=1 Tax=Brachypodium distachyon TaxID=15368 RepID=A0A2K2CUN3_BRADI|nr:hypothetical protein BRADI_3g01703v3 [Brachypodium distachyon]
MESKAGARTAIAALCLLVLLSLQQAAPVTAAWDPATFCPCYKQCFTECHGMRFFCATGCAKHCTTDTLDAAGSRRGHGGGSGSGRAALCKIACAAISICGGSAPAPPAAALAVAADDEAACVRDCNEVKRITLLPIGFLFFYFEL